MALKTYVLLENSKSSAEVFLRVNGNQRVRQDKRVVDHPYLQVGFTDRGGYNKVIRLKLNSNTIYQDEQMKLGVPANAKFTQAERDAVRFNHGVLVTGNPVVQQFLETSPEFDQFWIPDSQGRIGMCPDVHQPKYRLMDKEADNRSSNEAFRKRTLAAVKIMNLDLKSGQELMVRLNGSSFQTPGTLEEVQNELVAWLDEADEAGVDELLRDEKTGTEEALLLLDEAIKYGVVDMDAVEDSVVKVVRHTGRMIPLKSIPSSYASGERQRLFCEFLVSRDGGLVFDDLKNEVAQRKRSEAVDEARPNAMAKDESDIDGGEDVVEPDGVAEEKEPVKKEPVKRGVKRKRRNVKRKPR